MAPTPAVRSFTSFQTPTKTPQSKHRLNFPNPKGGTNSHLSLNPLSMTPTEHPVEVIGRIRDHLDRKDNLSSSSSALEISGDGRSLRVRSDMGYRDFSLDGVSLSEIEDLEGFYKRFVESRVEGVRSGAKCTIMMYGPTGAGKSHTMFGCGRQAGIVYRALRDILGKGNEDGGVDDSGFGLTLFVQVAVLEIYNEEIYDLLSGGIANGAGAGVALPKGSTPKARLEVMGRKAKNATYICGNEASKISREVAKVEKRRIVRSTLLNERSSRSHCVIIMDIPAVGGRLMLVDMAGSENIEQAGQAGFEAKIQTAKINQGNIALKRVVESIANGDSHVPFRDSKLTMLLQDSFEDDKSKILMILCASPDPKEMHKTIATLEYGAKAKCIVRVAHMPTPRDKSGNEDSSPLISSRIMAMNQFIYKLQMENKSKDRELDKARKELLCKDEVILQISSKLELTEAREAAAKEEIVKLRTKLIKMEVKVQQHEEELSFLRKQLEGIESTECEANKELESYLDGRENENILKQLAEMCAGGQGMEQSMELDNGDQQFIHDVKEIKEDKNHTEIQFIGSQQNSHFPSRVMEEIDFAGSRFPEKVGLSTVFERDDEGEDRESMVEEVDKEVVEEGENNFPLSKHQPETLINGNESDSARRTRIQNIFRLCGNHRELAQQVKVPTPTKIRTEDANLLRSSPLPSICSLNNDHESKENKEPKAIDEADMMDIYVKWEASKELSGNIVRKLKLLKKSTLFDLRKLIESHLEETNDSQPFVFLLLEDPFGAPVAKEKEAKIVLGKLPICNNGYLACLRPTKNTVQFQNHIPFSSIENTLPLHGMNS